MKLRNDKRPYSAPDGTFLDRNVSPGDERPGTVITADIFNQLLHEFENLFASAGITPSETNLSQMLDAVRKEAIDATHPIGSFYTQYTDESGNFIESESPSSRFGGVWQLMNYVDADGNGVTFRTAGGLANEDRINGIQKDAFQGHWHELMGTEINTSIRYAAPAGYTNGGLDGYGRSTLGGINFNGRLQARDLIKDNVHGNTRISNETRMTNIQIRVYKRIA